MCDIFVAQCVYYYYYYYYRPVYDNFAFADTNWLNNDKSVFWPTVKMHHSVTCPHAPPTRLHRIPVAFCNPDCLRRTITRSLRFSFLAFTYFFRFCPVR